MRTDRIALMAGVAFLVPGFTPAWAQVAPTSEAPVPQEADEGERLPDIVVTAQKRQQSANDVGLSITTLDADTISRRGVVDAYDLVKVVPGLSVANAGNGATLVYTLRGIGFNSSNLGATPTVSVYTDEIALPYPVMTQGAALDLERVEVLKGPQGTLFGQNSTAGAINYIARKPTDEVEGYVEASYGRFGWWNVKMAAGGPVTGTLKARFALSHDGGDGWQQSYTRDDSLGRRDKTQARVLLDWEPGSAVRFNLALNYWHDESESQALQLVRYAPLLPPGVPQVAAYPTAPRDPRAADWDPDKNFQYDTDFFQPSLRIDLDLTSNLTLTSVSAYSDYRTDSLIDPDGTSFEVGEIRQIGTIRDFNQEFRLSSDGDRFKWVVGANYQKNKIDEDLDILIRDLSNVQNIGGSGFSAILSPITSTQRTEAKAVFANAEYEFTDQFSVVAGARYTDTKIDFRGCNLDSGPPIPNTPTPGVTASLRGFFNILYGILTGNVGANPIQEGGCITLDNIARDGNPPTFLPTDSPQTLKEDNFSWNATANFKPNRDLLFYARIAQGYKSGSFPTIGASTSIQFLPARQEALRSYEAGVKATLADRTLQLDAAVFYYDYKDKQLSNFVPDAVFGPLVATVNIPESRVTGAEASATWAPVRGLTINGAVTYIDTRITEFVGFDENGVVTDFEGARFNLAPKWSATGDVNYDFPVGASLTGSVGGGLTYRSETTGIIGTTDPDYNIDAYTLVDLQAGIESRDGWNLRAWGKNVTNKYYWTNVNRVSDTIVRPAGMGATYGITAGYKF